MKKYQIAGFGLAVALISFGAGGVLAGGADTKVAAATECPSTGGQGGAGDTATTSTTPADTTSTTSSTTTNNTHNTTSTETNTNSNHVEVLSNLVNGNHILNDVVKVGDVNVSDVEVVKNVTATVSNVLNPVTSVLNSL